MAAIRASHLCSLSGLAFMPWGSNMNLFNPYRQFVGSFIPNCLMKYNGIGASAKLVWARLAQYSGDDGCCWPKQSTIAEDVGLSTDRIKRILKELETEGFIYVERATGKDLLNNAPNKYYFINHPIFHATPVVQNNPSRGGDSNTPRGGDSNTSFISKEKNQIEDNKTSGIFVTNSIEQNPPQTKTKRTKPPGAVRPDLPIQDSKLPQDFLDNTRLMAKWNEYKVYRSNIKNPLKQTGNVAANLVKLSSGCVETAILILQQSMDNEWVGLFDLKGGSNGARKNPTHLKPGNRNEDAGKYAGIEKDIYIH
jgi:hypothetical protein